MGGRGASLGISFKKKQYGTQYQTVFESGRIKFVKKTSRESEPLMETMSKGRIYVHVGGNDVLRIIRFNEENKRNKVIELDKRTGKWHVHNGYFHSEGSKNRHDDINNDDKKLIEKVMKMWENKNRK